MARLCPHCTTRSNFSRIYDGGVGNWGYAADAIEAHAALDRCQHCEGIIAIFSKRDGDQWVEFAAYPSAIPKVEPSIPAAVASDFVSAVNCLAIHEYKASATMFRRALQQIMIDKSAKGSQLQQQIDDLATKNIIQSDLKDWAHEIRLWGNEGAHPAKDGLKDITEDEIEDVKNFLENILAYVYVMPAKVAASRASRDARKAARMP